MRTPDRPNQGPVFSGKGRQEQVGYCEWGNAARPERTVTVLSGGIARLMKRRRIHDTTLCPELIQSPLESQISAISFDDAQEPLNFRILAFKHLVHVLGSVPLLCF